MISSNELGNSYANRSALTTGSELQFGSPSSSVTSNFGRPGRFPTGKNHNNKKFGTKIGANVSIIQVRYAQFHLRDFALKFAKH